MIFRSSGGYDLLGEDVQGLFGNDEPVQFSLMNRAHQGSAFEQLIPRGGEETAFGDRAAPVSGAAKALQGNADRPGRTYVEGKIYVPDIDTQLE